MHSRAKLVIAVALAASLGGCFKQSAVDLSKLLDQSADADKRPQGRTKIDVLARTLGNSQEVSLEPAVLLARVSHLVDSDKPAPAEGWVFRHPDAALDTLRMLDEGLPQESMALIADAHDRHTVAAGRSGWKRVLALSKTNRAALDAYSDARQTFHQRVADGLIDRALELNLESAADAADAVMLGIDARQLRGTALLLAERPAEAVTTFAEGVRLAEEVSPYQAVYLLLLQSDAERRGGNAPAAVDTWQRAVLSAAHLVTADPPVLDPVLWEKLSYLRPARLSWPADVVGELAARWSLPGFDSAGDAALASDVEAKPADAETIIWHAIGRWYLDRGHAQAALVAFKRAESSAGNEAARQWLRFRQAKALALLGQGGAATGILASLSAEKSSAVERPTAALLGSLYMQRGQSQRGLILLRKAVEAEDGVEWPERSEAEADLALAYLSVGDEQRGLTRLRRAEERFESEGEVESLINALENELRYVEHAKKRAETADVKTRLREAETGK